MVTFFPTSDLTLQGTALDKHQVHLWCTSLDTDPCWAQWLTSLLSEEEQERAARFHFPADARRFTLSRGMLRSLLSHYTGIPPRKLRFVYNRYGKPTLAGVPGLEGCHFNLSHCGDMALIAIARAWPVGVDLERLRLINDAAQIARRFFSPTEQATYTCLLPVSRSWSFFACWTRKEAFIKALGVGLSFPLQKFSVSLQPGESARLLSVAGDIQQAVAWSLYHLEPVAGYVGALAVPHPNPRISAWLLDWGAVPAYSLPSTETTSKPYRDDASSVRG